MKREDKHSEMPGLDEGEHLALYQQMKLIRSFENRSVEMNRAGETKFSRQIYAGEEAVAAGAIGALARDDDLVSTYNKCGHRLAAGVDAKTAMADLIGVENKETKTAAENRRYFVNDAASGLAVAAGLAMSVRYKNEATAVCCLFGDDVLSHGGFHEALNLASIQNLPIVFVCENNFYGMGNFIDNSVCQEELYKLAGAYKIEGVRVDGMDVLEVFAATQNALLRAREGEGPSLIEAVTYRYRSSTSLDWADYDSKRNEPIWRERDPILNFRSRLRDEKSISESKLDQIEREVEEKIADAARWAATQD
jgi:TPP-dependent pyruvate/acetoin dehydrogenase alpha subunit